MTNKEIKLELAKVALGRCSFTASESLPVAMRNLYEWIVEESEVEVETNQENQFDSVDIKELLRIIRQQGFYRSVTKLENAFIIANINTVGDLIRVGRHEFSQNRLVGRKSVSAIGDALEELGVTGW